MSELSSTALELRLVSSLEKIFPDSDVFSIREYTEYSALKGEVLSFQLAFRMYPLLQRAEAPKESGRFEIQAKTDIPGLSIRKVCQIPSGLPAFSNHDDNYLRTAPGLYPDLLSTDGVNIDPTQPHQAAIQMHALTSGWQSLWIDLTVPEDAAPGEHPVTIGVYDPNGSLRKQVTVTITVIDAVLPKLSLIHTEWFSYDCIENYYGVPALSERWWEITANFIRTAARRNCNMILTPIFTPPLDTVVGGERTPVQLVRMEYQNGSYQFDFSDLDRFVRLCQELGMEYFEMAHLFTQWGAKCTPNIYVWENGELTHRFGWHVSAVSPEYREFLDSFLPALTAHLRELQIADKSWFHISDEPVASMLEDYKAAKALVQEHLKDFPIIDALSHVEFYQEGLCAHPVPGNDAVHDFIDEKVPNLWTYYCCAQGRDVSNLFFAMPSARNRILGVQLYLYQMAGFLHWGYNFYNSQYSLYPINPYVTTDADGAFPSGDAFLVYPGADGQTLESIRLMVQSEAFQDLRALKLLEELIGYEQTAAVIQEGIASITFYSYPKSADYLLNLRKRVNALIKEHIK